MSRKGNIFVSILLFYFKDISLQGGQELFRNNSTLNKLTTKVCDGGIGTLLCENILFLAFGFSPTEADATLIPRITEQQQVGISSKQLFHYLQEVHSGIVNY